MQHYVQSPRYRNNLSVNQQMNGSRTCITYIMDYCSALIKEGNPVIWNNMDGPGEEGIMLSE